MTTVPNPIYCRCRRCRRCHCHSHCSGGSLFLLHPPLPLQLAPAFCPCAIAGTNCGCRIPWRLFKGRPSTFPQAVGGSNQPSTLTFCIAARPLHVQGRGQTACSSRTSNTTTARCSSGSHSPSGSSSSGSSGGGGGSGCGCSGGRRQPWAASLSTSSTAKGAASTTTSGSGSSRCGKARARRCGVARGTRFWGRAFGGDRQAAAPAPAAACLGGAP